ncbi:MAG: RNA-binding S4 domain-containing protein [Paludibacteraceae bacterium]|nr:RNA-binding S4 domain-containing protein [Paludibacteraceae bacterium]
MAETLRIDKWLWTMRLFKTRTIATEECKKGRIVVGGTPVKPSFVVTAGMEINVKRPPVVYTYRIIELTQNRVGAKDVTRYMIDITPSSELKLLEDIKLATSGVRDRGTGRPTKKERRELDDFLGVES